MVGLGGDNDDDMDLGSNYQYGQDIRSPQYNSRGDRSSSPSQNMNDNNFRYGATFNGRLGGKLGAKKNGGWHNYGANTNGIVRPGSSTNATLRDIRSRTDARAKRRSLRSQDMNDEEIELNSLDRDSNLVDEVLNEIEFNGNGHVKRREAAEDLDRSRLQLGTDEDNSQIKLIPKEVRGSDSNLQPSDVGSKVYPDIELQMFEPSERTSLYRPTDIT